MFLRNISELEGYGHKKSPSPDEGRWGNDIAYLSDYFKVMMTLSM